MTCRSPVDICAVRLSRLDGTGAPAGASSSGAVAFCSGVSKLTWTGTYITVPAIQELDGCGGLAINVPAEQRLTGYNVELDMLIESDEFHELATDATLITDMGGTLGYAVLLDTACEGAAEHNGVSVEAWSRNLSCDTVDAEFPWLRTVFSKVKFTPGDGSRQKAANHIVLKGVSFPNKSLGSGAYADFPTNMPDGFAFAQFIDTDLPFCHTNCGYVATPILS